MAKLKSNRPIPLLFVGDGESLTGLSRIGHDLAWLTSSMPEFKVGYLGRQSLGSSKRPWAQYSFPMEGQWGEAYLERAWTDLAGDDEGIIFTVWDASRLLWFADGRATGLEAFLHSGKFQRWGYFMADGAGVDPAQLPLEQAHVVSQYNRCILASRWAYELAAGLPCPDIDWIPHPINREVFKPLPRLYARSGWGVNNTQTVIGCVMANQARKHWPVVMEALALLSGVRKPKLWIHTDTLHAYWNIQALAVEYGVADQIIYEDRGLNDTEMAMRYSACDVTLVISGGEGFCYPIAESLSCGTPAITGAYGAHSELTPWTVPPLTTLIDTSHNVRRAVYSHKDVARQLDDTLRNGFTEEQCTGLVEHLNMAQLGLVWKKWFKEGLQ